MDKKLSTQDYMEIIKRKREQGTYDYADRVFYKGKVLMKCPPGATKVGNTCMPSDGLKASTPGGKTWKRDLGGVNPQQVQKLGIAKTSQDVLNARKKNG